MHGVALACADEALTKVKKEKADLASHIKDMEAQMKVLKLELANTKDKLSAAEVQVDVVAAAAAGKAREMLAKEVAEAYKEGMNAARGFLKDMRSMF